jgi:hypothetical protein
MGRRKRKGVKEADLKKLGRGDLGGRIYACGREEEEVVK